MSFPLSRRPRSAHGWDPLAGIPGVNELFDHLSHLLSSAFPDVGRIRVDSWSPPVDIREVDDGYLVEADLPGVPAENISVDLRDRDLHITGAYGPGPESDREESQARRTGRFDYRLTLPGEVDSQGCTADLENGVLRLRLPKTTEGTPQRIPVRSGSSPGPARGDAPAVEGTDPM